MAKTDYYCRKHGPTYEPNYGWGPAGPRCRVCSGEHQQRVAGCELRLQIAEDMAASETKPAGVVGAPAPKQPAPIVDFQIAADTAKSETKPAGATAPKQPALDATLAECGSRYGDFTDHARIVDAMLGIAEGNSALGRFSTSWEKMKPHQRQALRVIFDKLARILNGDPDYADNWHDLQGYAKLVEDRLN